MGSTADRPSSARRPRNGHRGLSGRDRVKYIENYTEDDKTDKSGKPAGAGKIGLVG